jgi:SAM-dependent methyltransferase
VPGAYLELGPDIGLLTRELARNDAYSEVILLEPNVNVRDALEKNSSGLPSPRISELDLKDEKLPDASLSAVVMVHVFDHLYDLSGYLQELHRVTKPGGRMFIVTHNADCLLARVLKARFPPYALQHPQLFTPASITEVLARHGFEVVKVEKTTNYFPIAYLVRAVMDIFGLPSRWIPNLENPMLGIGLGNIATVAVRK